MTFWVAGAAVVGAGVSAAASSSAANKASNAQMSAASLADATQREQFNQTRDDQAPWRSSGVAALNALNNGLGLNVGASMNAMYGAPTESRDSFDADAYMAAHPDVADPRQWASGDAYSHYLQYGKAQGYGFTGNAQYNQQLAAQQNPQAQPQGAQAGFGDLNRPSTAFSTPFNFQADPGYDFRMAEGAKGINNSAAARGGVLSGAALKAASKYNQNFASNEYNNSFNRYQTENTNQFNRDTTNQTNSFNRLASLAGVGQTAANQTAAAGQNMANNVSQNQLAAGNAQASGIVGQSNALTGGLASGYNMYQQQQMMGLLGNRNAAGTAGMSGYNALGTSGPIGGTVDNPAYG